MVEEFPGERDRIVDADSLVFDKPNDKESARLAAELPVPDPDEEPMVVTTFRLPESLRTQLKAEAKRRGIDASTLVRGWLVEMLRNDTSPQVVNLRTELHRVIDDALSRMSAA